MKFLHLGDLHLGRSLGDYDLYDDQKFILNEILEIIDKKGIQSVLIAGDVYDKSIPSEAATRLLDEFLVSLTERNVNTFMISGNHDSDDRLNFGSRLFASNQIYISAVFDGELHKETVSDEYGEIDIWLLPFVKASQVRHFYPDAKIESYDDAVKTIIENADIDTGRRNIIVAHQFVAGTDSPVLGGSESQGTQNVGLVEVIGYKNFDSFDYAALGHIHSPQRVGREEVRYSGSPLKYSLSEVNNEKSVPIITFGEKGDVKIELEPLKPLRDLRHIRGKMEELLSKPENANDYIYATLTDEDYINDVMGIFQQTYPYTVKVDYDNSHTREIEKFDISGMVQNKSVTELISDFYKTIYGQDISEEEMGVMRMVAREAGALDETD